MKTLFEKLAIIIDKSGKILSRFKTVGTIIVIVILVVSLTNNGCSKHRANELFERVTGLNIQNDILLADIKVRELLIALKDSVITDREKQLSLKQSEYNVLQNENKNLKKKFNNIPGDIIKLPTDSSYSFLTKIAYPFPGELKYPFNEPQVKSFHVTYLERLVLEEENENLVNQVSNFESRLFLTKSNYEDEVLKYSMAIESIGDYKLIIGNKDEEIVLKDKAIRKKDNRSLIWKVTVGVLIGILIIK